MSDVGKIILFCALIWTPYVLITIDLLFIDKDSKANVLRNRKKKGKKK